MPEIVAAEKGTTRQVQPGKGYLYTHKRASPEYIDSIEEPYVRFVFNIERKVSLPPLFFEGHDEQCGACRWGGRAGNVGM